MILLSEFHNGSGTKNRFQQLWMYKTFKHRKHPCIPCLGETQVKLQWYNIYLHFSSFFWFGNATIFHSGYVIKPPQPSSAICGAPPFSGNPPILWIHNFSTQLILLFIMNPDVEITLSAWRCIRVALRTGCALRIAPI